jgi:hypothetical protein
MTPAERLRLIEQYKAGPALLRAAWNDVPAPARQWRPEPGAWSAHEIIVHCADSEAYAAIRIRLLAAEETPVIVGYDQEAWARIFDYHDLPVEPAFAVIDAVRASTGVLIDRLTDEQWTKVGTHTESGPYSATDWLRSYAAHLHDHVAQIQANLALWQSRN